MEEIWKDIKGYEGLYQVSNFGRVKRLPRTQVMPVNGKKVVFPERILKKSRGSKNRNYIQVTVTLSKYSKVKTKIVARLVAEQFLENAHNLPEIHHIDHDTENNRSDNLKWVKRKEQFDLHHSQEASNSLKGKVATNKRRVEVEGHIYPSATEACFALGWSKDILASAKHRGQEYVKGKKFKYID